MNIRSKKFGFTLLEMVIVLGILGVITIGLGRLDRDSLVLQGVFEEELDSAFEARKILKPMVQEIRGVTTSHEGSYPIETASTTTFTFFSNIDTDSTIERVRYFLEDNTLKKGIIEPTGSPLQYDLDDEQVSDVINNVVSSEVFYYYDSSYDGTGPALTQPVNLNDIRLVKVALSIDADPLQPPDAFELETQVSLRNLKDNL